MIQSEEQTAGHFSEAKSVETVIGRIGSNAEPRLREIVSSVIKHLHEVVKETGLTPEEWMTGIQFLTEVGHMCSDWRQEFILLSDVLGVSSLVETINHRRPHGATENTILGPFYVKGAPHYENGANICLDGKGEPTLVEGRVLDPDARPIAGATIDVWQTNDSGFYDVQQKGIQPDFNLRGIFTSDHNGFYRLCTAKPRYYPIPNDGPVGKLLESLDRHPNRAAHIHFIVSAPGYDTVTTHLFTPDCPYLGEDAVFGVKSSLIATFTKVNDHERASGLGFDSSDFWYTPWDFVLSRKGASQST